LADVVGLVPAVAPGTVALGVAPGTCGDAVDCVVVIVCAVDDAGPFVVVVCFVFVLDVQAASVAAQMTKSDLKRIAKIPPGRDEFMIEFH
jgi:hypothetical protein